MVDPSLTRFRQEVKRLAARVSEENDRGGIGAVAAGMFNYADRISGQGESEPAEQKESGAVEAPPEEISHGLDEAPPEEISHGLDEAPPEEISHGLDEDFRNRKPSGFRLGAHAETEIDTWRELYERFCRVLAIAQGNEFTTVVTAPEFLSGRGGNRYFAGSPNLLRRPFEVTNEVFAESPTSTRAHCKRIEKLLTYFGYVPGEFELYIREDVL